MAALHPPLARLVGSHECLDAGVAVAVRVGGVEAVQGLEGHRERTWHPWGGNDNNTHNRMIENNTNNNNVILSLDFTKVSPPVAAIL